MPCYPTYFYYRQIGSNFAAEIKKKLHVKRLKTKIMATAQMLQIPFEEFTTTAPTGTSPIS